MGKLSSKSLKELFIFREDLYIIYIDLRKKVFYFD